MKKKKKQKKTLKIKNKEMETKYLHDYLNDNNVNRMGGGLAEHIQRSGVNFVEHLKHKLYIVNECIPISNGPLLCC